MIRYIIRRLLWAVVLFIAITLLTYVIFFMIPADPARKACGQLVTPACVKQARKNLGLDKPVYVQYGRFLKRVVIDRSLGHSFANRQDVNTIIARAAPVTASLVFGGAILWLAIGLLVGIFSALKPRSLLDRAGMVFVLVGVSAHPVWIGLIFSYFFGYKLRNFPIHTPIAGYAHIFNAPPGQPGGVAQWAYHLILPWCTFAILFAAWRDSFTTSVPPKRASSTANTCGWMMRSQNESIS